MTLTVEERYQTDPQFRTLVEMMFNFIANAQFTPTELREAAILAATKYELTWCRPRVLDDNLICVDLGLWKTYTHHLGPPLSEEAQAKATEKVHRRLHNERKPHIHIDGTYDKLQ